MKTTDLFLSKRIESLTKSSGAVIKRDNFGWSAYSENGLVTKSFFLGKTNKEAVIKICYLTNDDTQWIKDNLCIN